MRSLQFAKFTAISVLCLGLFACATAGHNKPASGNSYDEKNIESSGVGSETSFDEGKGTGNALKPGCNQIYYFDYDSSTVHEEDQASINVQAKYLTAHPKAKVRLEGNTDNRGSREYNIALGERRANRVAECLKSNGVASNQIKTVSFGAQKPVAFGSNDEDYQLNRRVELIYETK